MPYGYCARCKEEMEAPTIRQVLSHNFACGCGEVRSLTEWEIESAVDEFMTRIETLERLLGVTP